MSVSEDFRRWLAAARGLEDARREGRSPEYMANTIRLYSETLEALLRSIVNTVRRNEINIQRLSDRNWETIAGEVEPLRSLLSEVIERVYQVEQMQAETEAEEANFDAPG